MIKVKFLLAIVTEITARASLGAENHDEVSWVL